MSKKQTSLEDQLYIIGLCLLLAAPLIIIAYRYLCARLSFLMMLCLLRTFTGYYCPGCGGTRAADALLHLQLWRSFCYHPLVPYGAAVYLWFMISHTIEKLSRHRLRIGMKWNPAWLWIALIILVLNVLVKDGALLLFHIDLLQMIP
ncbi:MAG: DUF2752 domain-containing protein [Eubacterium sp.]|nr:DUF2752 domain-containing protein [Eubacterium sp.]